MNKIWWLCLVPTSTTRFASDLGYRMAKNLIGLYIYFLWTVTSNSWTQNEEHDIPAQILKTILDRMPQLVFFRPQYVWFPSHLYIDVIPNSSGQSTELIVYIIPLENSRWIPRTTASDVEVCLFLICAWISFWVNKSEAGDWRRHCAHYDTNVM